MITGPDNKVELLRSLAIDRTGTGAGRSAVLADTVRRRRPWRMTVGLAVAAAAGLGVMIVAGQEAPRPSLRAAVEYLADRTFGTAPPTGEPVHATEAPAMPTARPAAVAPSAEAAVPAPAPAVPLGAGGRRTAGALVASGYVTARRSATVSAEITGRVQEVLVEEGVAVADGQVVARLDAALAEIDLHLAEARRQGAVAALAVAVADLRDAEAGLARTRNLSQRGVASDADLIRTETRAESLRAQVERAKAELRIAELEVARRTELVEQHVLRAPFAGVVVEKSAQAGEIVSPMSAGGGFTRTGVATIVDMNSLEVEVDVNEGSIGRVTPGQPVEAVLEAYPDWAIPASVLAVVPTANRERATIRVRIALRTKDARILPDMAVRVAFLAEPTDAGQGEAP